MVRVTSLVVCSVSVVDLSLAVRVLRLPHDAAAVADDDDEDDAVVLARIRSPGGAAAAAVEVATAAFHLGAQHDDSLNPSFRMHARVLAIPSPPK